MQTVIDGEKVASGQIVGPLNEEFLTAARFEGGARPAPAVGPQTRWRQIPVELCFDLAHGDSIVRRLSAGLAGHASQFLAPGDYGNWEGIDKLRKGIGIDISGGLGVQRRWRSQCTRILKKTASSDCQTIRSEKSMERSAGRSESPADLG
jgi:hypothetical protein